MLAYAKKLAEMNARKFLHGKALYESLLERQLQWIESCGGDRVGYVKKYHMEYERPLAEALDIYEADVGELKRIQAKLAR